MDEKTASLEQVRAFTINLDALPSFSHVTCKKEKLDHLLIKNYLNYTPGFFIEVGGLDGVMQSNTCLLEKALSWRGILIEPSPNGAELCRRNRSSSVHQCALVDFDYTLPTIRGDFNGHPMSSVGGVRLGRPANVEVPARTLQSILDEEGQSVIDFFSLDVEGYELDVLKGIDFTRTIFKYLLIEIYIKDLNEISMFLSEKGYQLIGCITNYNPVDNPGWDGTHNDFLFKRRV